VAWRFSPTPSPRRGAHQSHCRGSPPHRATRVASGGPQFHRKRSPHCRCLGPAPPYLLLLKFAAWSSRPDKSRLERAPVRCHITGGLDWRLWARFLTHIKFCQSSFRGAPDRLVKWECNGQRNFLRMAHGTATRHQIWINSPASQTPKFAVGSPK
jgi:hypothetical protein